MTWYDGPRVELSADRVAMINNELAQLIEKKAHGRGFSCVIASRGIASIEMKWSPPDFPEKLQDKLAEYINYRVDRLAQEQEGVPSGVTPMQMLPALSLYFK